MQQSELIDRMQQLSAAFASEIKDNQDKKFKLRDYQESISGREWELQQHRGRVNSELDLSVLKTLKIEQREKENELDEVNRIIENLTTYTSNHQSRLSVILKEYQRAEKEFYLLIANKCREEVRAFCEGNDEFLKLMKDFIVANANALNGIANHEYGAVFLAEFGRFKGDEYMEHKINMRRDLGIPDLESN